MSLSNDYRPIDLLSIMLNKLKSMNKTSMNYEEALEHLEVQVANKTVERGEIGHLTALTLIQSSVQYNYSKCPKSLCDFLESNAVQHPNAKVSERQFMQNYKNYCAQHRHRALTKTAVRDVMRTLPDIRLDSNSMFRGKRANCYIGITLIVLYLDI